MANKNKNKGDRAERAVRDWAVKHWPDSFKTRAGFSDDLGDVIATHPAGNIVLQVKDVAKPDWKKWFKQIREQVETCRAKSKPVPVLGGVIVHKARGVSDPARWRAVVELESLHALIDEAYNAGLEAGARRGRAMLTNPYSSNPYSPPR
ncbi:holliday junction resolvase [Corynebacterium phage EmiRose]|uniref:Holliday junction resolvase n=1 Tax=Corynebacterium phage EmiRose TaxID=2565372 RepID=A0A649VQ53_9CAUD|nr:holliday junction resolvase [Corynebacterium phage EmiRose]QGJ94175.1 holliday junction resolvase [Corynebacterium phage EmiRose]